jgi:hypothetical protein
MENHGAGLMSPLHLRAIDDARRESDAPTVITYGPGDAMKKLPPKTEPGEPSEWDRLSSAAGRQLRLDFYLDDAVAMRKQAQIVVEFGRRVEMLCNDPSLSPRSLLIHIRQYASVARAMLEEAAPSQQVRLLARKQPRVRE